MEIRYAQRCDFNAMSQCDRHLREEALRLAIEQRRVLIAEADGKLAGWLRYGLFWDMIPFMNMLHFLECERGKGYGRLLTQFWEEEMRKQGYERVMTSSQSDEYGQHFYTKMGYRAVGSFLLEGDVLEILFEKRLR